MNFRLLFGLKVLFRSDSQLLEEFGSIPTESISWAQAGVWADLGNKMVPIQAVPLNSIFPPVYLPLVKEKECLCLSKQKSSLILNKLFLADPSCQMINGSHCVDHQ